jgi:hypothetical protein
MDDQMSVKRAKGGQVFSLESEGRASFQFRGRREGQFFILESKGRASFMLENERGPVFIKLLFKIGHVKHIILSNMMQ